MEFHYMCTYWPAYLRLWVMYLRNRRLYSCCIFLGDSLRANVCSVPSVLWIVAYLGCAWMHWGLCTLSNLPWCYGRKMWNDVSPGACGSTHRLLNLHCMDETMHAYCAARDMLCMCPSGRAHAGWCPRPQALHVLRTKKKTNSCLVTQKNLKKIREDCVGN